MTTYSELVKIFREKNAKPKGGWRYESWADSASDEQQVARLPYGTQGTYDVPAQAPIPNWRDLIREEGVQVGQQVKEGGRIYDNRKYFKPGGLVEPGVTHYAKYPKKKGFVWDLDKKNLENLK